MQLYGATVGPDEDNPLERFNEIGDQSMTFWMLYPVGGHRDDMDIEIMFHRMDEMIGSLMKSFVDE